MTTDIAWLMIIANAVIAVITITNSWALAWYAKKPKKRLAKQKEKDVALELHKRPSLWRAALNVFNIVLSVLTLIYLALHPNPDLYVQILQIALTVGFAVLALTLSLIGPLVEIAHAQLDVLIRVTELTAKLAEAMAKKSPNPMVESDAREDGERGLP